MCVCVVELHIFTVSSNNSCWCKSGACEGQCVLARGVIVDMLSLSQELYMYSNNYQSSSSSKGGTYNPEFLNLQRSDTHTVLRTGLQGFAGDPGPAALAPPA